MNKIDINESTGTLKTNTLTFAIILVIVVYIFAQPNILPAIALGPVAEIFDIIGGIKMSKKKKAIYYERYLLFFN